MTTKVEFFSSLKSNQVLCTKQIINIDIKLKKVLVVGIATIHS